MRTLTIWLMVILATVLARPTLAAVDLVTLPTREGTQLTIYNSEDITMVREHRLLTVKPGVNRIQFAWTNTLIDPTSIEFRILDHQDTIDLADTTYPSGRNDALQWNINSKMAGKVPVEIRYFKDITVRRRLKDQRLKARRSEAHSLLISIVSTHAANVFRALPLR